MMISKETLSTLTPRELQYFRTMNAKYGVLFLTSAPGLAKSAIALSIAKKIGAKYIDMRLAMADETDFKFPYKEKMSDGKGGEIWVSDYTVPKWAYDSNKQLTIIHFEELNRAPLQVRNAALQILLERGIGDFEFNDNVLMLASGNLGEEDNTDVEELDAALNNRLVHVKHHITAEEWLEQYAKENIHFTIYDFIKSQPEYFYVKPKEGKSAYATPRSWTILSKNITENFDGGTKASIKDFREYIGTIGNGVVGDTMTQYLRYLNTLELITVQDVLNDMKRVREVIERGKIANDFFTEIMTKLQDVEYKPDNLTDKQLKNVAEFIMKCNDEISIAYIATILQRDNGADSDKVKSLFKMIKPKCLAYKELHQKRGK